ncbi:MAG: hypothetical protein IT360_25600 [Gemmatimonadaceae bacterium]|nr:hypothetical protein [Gemmatimonadaceae bacterium]
MPNDSTGARPRTAATAAAPAPYSEASFIPVATPRTLALRTFLPWQLWRFVVINVRMLRMIAKSHE